MCSISICPHPNLCPPHLLPPTPGPNGGGDSTLAVQAAPSSRVLRRAAPRCRCFQYTTRMGNLGGYNQLFSVITRLISAANFLIQRQTSRFSGKLPDSAANFRTQRQTSGFSGKLPDSAANFPIQRQTSNSAANWVERKIVPLNGKSGHTFPPKMYHRVGY